MPTASRSEYNANRALREAANRRQVAAANYRRAAVRNSWEVINKAQRIRESLARITYSVIAGFVPVALFIIATN